MTHLLSFFLFISIFSIQVYGQQSPTKTLIVTVLNEDSKPIVNLPQSAFKVYEDKKVQTITSVNNNEKPVSIGFLFDVSNSVSSNKNETINLARKGFFEFVKSSNSLNEYFIMGFNDQARLVTDWTSDKDKITDGLNQLLSLRTECSRSCSPVYDAYFTAIEKLIKSNHSKRVLIVVTDGQDIDSKHSQKELMQLAREKDILTYGLLAYGQGRYDEYHRRIMSLNEDFMHNLSYLTGGNAYSFPNPRGDPSAKQLNRLNTEFEKIFETIASTLKSQYEISYNSSNNDSGKKPHKIKVELNLSPELKKQIGKFQILHRLEAV